MEKLHELTVKIKDCYVTQQKTIYSVDRLIREELEKMAKKLREAYGIKNFGGQIAGKGFVESILGLTDEGEKPMKEPNVEKSLDDLIAVQVSDPSNKTDSYMRGLSNGLLLAKSLFGHEYNPLPPTPKPEQKQSWCEKQWICPKCTWANEPTWKYCPEDGTPRPTPKPLVERFRDEICYLLPDKDNPSTNKTGRLTCGCAGRLAKIAEEHFGKKDFLREHKEEL